MRLATAAPGTVDCIALTWSTVLVLGSTIWSAFLSPTYRGVKGRRGVGGCKEGGIKVHDTIEEVKIMHSFFKIKGVCGV